MELKKKEVVVKQQQIGGEYGANGQGRPWTAPTRSSTIGPSMKAFQAKVQVHAHVPSPAETAIADSPASVLSALIAGNKRYVNGTFGSASAHMAGSSSPLRAKLVNGQSPLVAVIGCADSRVPVETVFDATGGEIFTVRVAGSVYSPAAAGSIDYAVKYLGSKVLMILGHSACGAIKAAQLSESEIMGETLALAQLLFDIKEGLTTSGTPDMVERNVEVQVARAMKNSQLKRYVEEGKLIVVGAVYDLATGNVNLLECCHSCEPPEVDQAPVAG